MKVDSGKVITEEPQENGDTKIIEEGFRDNILKTKKVKVRRNIPTTKFSLLKDLIGCLEPIKNKSDVEIVVKQVRGEPVLIQTTWTIADQT